MSKLLFIVVGARPNFIKIAPIIKELEKSNTNYKLIHTGQHYDESMSDVFFKDLEIPKADVNFNIKSTYQGQQISKIISMFEVLCYKNKPNCVMVLGDVNSTLATALVTSKMNGIELVHVESGERSYDRLMPEEINRTVVDHLSDHLFCTTNSAQHNLNKESIDKDKIHVVGNTMIDNLINHLSIIEKFNIKTKQPYIIVTLHRAHNTDNPKVLEEILQAIEMISKEIQITFPIHPRTESRIKQFNLQKYLNGINITAPMGYLEFIAHVKKSKMILTDSGGLQTEAAFLNIPCLTMRDNTEHINTIKQGVNVLVGTNKDQILESFFGKLKFGNMIIYKDKLFDGYASKRIVKILGAKNLI